MGQTLGYALILAITWTVAFYAARVALNGVISLIHQSAVRSTRRDLQDGG